MRDDISTGGKIWNYLKEIRGRILLAVLLCAAYNCYFVLLLPMVRLPYLSYLNFLVGTLLVFYGVLGYLHYARDRGPAEREERMGALEDQAKEQYALNRDLQDYITKWCHEVKIPLSASLLMSEKIGDAALRRDLREQLERMNSLLKNALLGCKVQGSMFDLQIHRVELAECVRASVHNNQFFLIQEHFELELGVGEGKVYTDKSWLVYVLDQLISNAIKYAGRRRKLKIWSGTEEWDQGKRRVRLYVEDEGVGIEEGDLRRIFEKGFTGRNTHNGQYKSTGMGLYMAKVILDRLGHGIGVESACGRYTRFTITFADNSEYFLQEM